MKRLYICCYAFLLIIVVAYAGSGRTGDEIKLYLTGRDIRPVVDHLNFLVAPESLKFQITDKESDADVSIRFQDDIGDPNAVGVSFALFGQIYIKNSLPQDQVYVVLIHEILHCAGVGHEPEDRSSVMYTHSQKEGQLKKWHAQYLRRLAGITFSERLVAQIRLLF